MTSDATHSPAVENALLYAAGCARVLDAANAALDTANHALGARKTAAMRPQHEISIRRFTEMAEDLEQQFPPLYKAFLEACATARSAAQSLRSSAGSDDPEAVLLGAVGGEAYGEIGPAAHILRATFGPTPASFVDGIQAANAAIQADIFSYGEEGFIGHVYSPPGSDHWNRLRMYAANSDEITIDRDFGDGLILRVRVDEGQYPILAAQNGPNLVTFEGGLGPVDGVDLRRAAECAAITPGGVVCLEGSVSIRSSHSPAALDRDAFMETLAAIIKATSDYFARA